MTTQQSDSALVPGIENAEFPGIGTIEDYVSHVEQSSPGRIDTIRRAWKRLSPQILEMFPENRPPPLRCDYVPRTFVGFLHHILRVQYAEERARSRYSTIHGDERLADAPPEDYQMRFWKMRKSYGGEAVPGLENHLDPERDIDRTPDHPFRTPVLAKLSIWTWYGPQFTPPWRSMIDWPCSQELSWEGDQRV